MSQLMVLLAPEDQSPPDHTKSQFAAAAGWFDQANRNAPDAISGEFAVYKTAYDEYAHYLSTVGYNLDVVFSTPEGQQLAIDTSHTLTPAIVHYVIDECGLSFGEPQEPPTS